MDARERIADVLRGWVDQPDPDDHDLATSVVLAAADDVLYVLEAAGYRVVPADLVTNAAVVVERLIDEASCCDDCRPWDDPVRDALAASLAASLAAYRGDDPLEVFMPTHQDRPHAPQPPEG